MASVANILQASVQSATAEARRRADDVTTLSRDIARFDLKVLKNVAYDGNCFFNAVGAIIGEDGSRLRRDIADHTAKELETSGATTSYSIDLVDLLREPYRDVEDARVAKAVANHLQRTVHILTCFPDGSSPLRVEEMPPRTMPKKSDIYIGHIADTHFVPLAKVNKRKVSRVLDEHVPKRASDMKRNKISDFFRPIAVADLLSATESSATTDDLASIPTAVPATATPAGTSSMTSADPGSTRTALPVPVLASTGLPASAPTAIPASAPYVDATLLENSEALQQCGNARHHTGSADAPVTVSDIGLILNYTLSANEASVAVEKLSDDQKLILVKEHFTPDKNYEFRTRFLNNCNRRCPGNYKSMYPWLVYSDVLDGVFCIHCALFAKTRIVAAQLVNAPFSKWSKFKEKMEAHAKTGYHKESMERGSAFQQKMEQPEVTLPRVVNTELQKRVEENTIILGYIVKAILFCARQGIALRGDDETRESIQINPGNFLAYLIDKADENETLKTHLSQPRKKNATYMSPSVQNELIHVIGSFITDKLVRDIHTAIFYTVMADEVTSHNTEIMPVCVRYLGDGDEIREDFIEFVHVERTTGTFLGNAIIETLQKKNIPIENMRGQCYDGAANMSSDRCGVQKCIGEFATNAPYTHCNSHALNLVIVHSCKQTEISHTLDKLKSVCIFYKYSPKREGLLHEIMSQGIQSPTKRKAILNLCKTRWAERHVAFAHFYDSYVYIVESLEYIAHGVNRSGYDLHMYQDKWDPSSRSDAASYLHALTSFSFIIAFMVVYQGLAILSGISVQLQQKALDVYHAYSKVDSVKDAYKALRTDVDDRFHVWFKQASKMADRVGVKPEMPRIAARQTHRSNSVGDRASCTCDGTCEHKIETYYRINYATPFIDHINVELDLQFSSLAVTASKLLVLIPAVFKSADHHDINLLGESYADDLPTPALLEEEHARWVNRFVSESDLPSTCSSALRSCDPCLYPNIHILLRIACTLPVTSAECERAGSALRRLHNYSRASMTSGRLSSLALMHIHYGFKHDVREIVARFVRLHPRRMELESLL